MVLFIVILICLSAKAAVGRHSAGYALGHFDPTPSGWTPGWSFFIGLLPVSLRIGKSLLAQLTRRFTARLVVLQPQRNQLLTSDSIHLLGYRNECDLLLRVHAYN